MNREEAIAFLESHQPLPNDDELDNKPELMVAYDEARKYFLAHPDPVCIPLFLRSFGGANGFGLYQLIEDVLWKYEPEQVIQYLISNLSDPGLPEHTLYWNTEISADFPDERLLPYLLHLLNHCNDDVRMAAATALAQIGGEDAFSALKLQLSQEHDENVRQHIGEIIADFF